MFVKEIVCPALIEVLDAIPNGYTFGSKFRMRNGPADKAIPLSQRDNHRSFERAKAVVGMGAVVTKDVPPGVTVVGNPARNMTH